MKKLRYILLFCMTMFLQGAWAQVVTSGTCGDGQSDLRWSVSKSAGSERYDVLTITGTGNMLHFSKGGTPWYADFNDDIRTINIDEGVNSIGQYAFYNIWMNEISLPNSLQTISGSAFEACDLLQTIHLGSGLTRIEADAFKECDHIGQIYCAVTDPSQLTWLGNSATTQLRPNKGTLFYVSNPQAWHNKFPNANVTFTSEANVISGTALSYRFCYDHGTPTLLFYKSGTGSTEIPGRETKDSNYPSWYSMKDKAVKLVIGDGITKIGQYAFFDFTSTKTLVIGKDVTETGFGAFYNTTNLNECTFAEGSVFTTLGEYTFWESGLTQIELPASLTTIERNSFGYTKIKELVVPDNVTSIGIATFEHCVDLETVYLGTGIRNIELGAFATGYYGYIPEAMHKNKLADIYCPADMDPNNWDFWDQYGHTDFESYDAAVIGQGVSDHKPRLHLKPNVNIAAWNARFSGRNITLAADLCGNQAYGVVELNTLSIYGRGTMYDFNTTDFKTPWYDNRGDIQKLSIDERMENIGSYAFYDCNALSKVVIPDNITSIGDNAFYCTSRTTESHITLNIDPDELTWYIEDSPLGGIDYCHVHVADPTEWPHTNPGDKFYGIKAIWDGAEAYAVYRYVQEANESQQTCVLTFYNDHLRLTRQADATFRDIPWSSQPIWTDDFNYYYYLCIEKVVFDPSFASVRLPTGKKMFMNLNILKSIEGMEYLNTSEMTSMDQMFNKCRSLKAIDLSHFNTAKVTSMRGMFMDCRAVTSLDITTFDISKVTAYHSIFRNCNSLTTIYSNSIWPDKNSDSYYMFQNCSVLAGGQGTTYANINFDYNQYERDCIYAHPDGGSTNPGYFTATGVLLFDDQDNSTTIADNNKQSVTIVLQGRTLYKDGMWNTLCLPFSLDATKLAASPLKGCTLMTLNTANFSGGTLTLDFEESTTIESGKPYLIKWESGDNLTERDLVFKDVTISESPADVVCNLGNNQSISFRGTYKKLSYDTSDRSILFLGGQDLLYYPMGGATIGAQRAYFELTGITAGDKANQASAFVLNFGNGETTGIVEMRNEEGEMRNGNERMINDAWYTLDGRKLSAKPTAKGVYVNNGKKVVIK